MEERRVLDSWKEISDYLGRSVKTCRRWEHELRLPVHRLEESPKARVFAYPDELDQWIKTTKKSQTAIKIPLPIYRRKPKIFYLAFLAMCAIVITFLVWRLFPKKQLATSLSEKPTLAILYFDNLSKDKSLDPWKTGLTELLITKLAQSKFIDVLDSNTIYSIMKKLDLEESNKYTKEDLIKIISEGRATHTLSGSIMKAGQKIILTLSLQNPHEGKIISSIPLECRNEEEFIPKIDEVSRQIKSDLALSPQQIAGDIDKDLSKITTASSEAFKYYSQGRDFHKNLNFEQSIALMEKAVDLDPGFAMAYRSMATSYNNLGNPTKRKEFVQKAFELKERISDREQFLIQGDYYYESERTYEKAIEAYLNLLEIYPDDPMGNHSLGSLYMEIEDWDKAIERYETIIKIKTPDFISYWNLAESYEAKGLYEKAVETIERYAVNFSKDVNSHYKKASIYASQGKYDMALAEANNAFFLDPTYYRNNIMIGYISLLKGDFKEAEITFQKVIDTADENIHKFQATEGLVCLYLSEGKFGKSKEKIMSGLELSKKTFNASMEAFFHDDLGLSLLKSGDFPFALEEFEWEWNYAVEAGDFARQRIALWKIGLTYIGMKNFQRAHDTAERLKEMIENGLNRKAIRLYYHLKGRSEIEEKNYPQAIDYLNKALSLLPKQYVSNSDNDALFYDTLALAYFKSGDLENAKRQYERIISLTWGRYFWGDIYARSFYMLAKICEQQGEKAEAREKYIKFLNLWKDADPGIAEVEDAKVRLAKIQNY